MLATRQGIQGLPLHDMRNEHPSGLSHLLRNEIAPTNVIARDHQLIGKQFIAYHPFKAVNPTYVFPSFGVRYGLHQIMRPFKPPLFTTFSCLAVRPPRSGSFGIFLVDSASGTLCFGMLFFDGRFFMVIP
jgi:hypothetical protein